MSIEAAQTLSIKDNVTSANKARVAEFKAFVTQNANVLGESLRAPGLKAPLGLLVSMCPVEVTEENVDLFFTEARQMLINATNENIQEQGTEVEEVEESEAVRDEIAEAEQQQSESKPNLKEEIKKTESETNIPRWQEQATSNEEVVKTEKINDHAAPEKEREAAQPTNLRTGGAGAVKDTKPTEASLRTNTSSELPAGGPSPATEAKPKAKSVSAPSSKGANRTTDQDRMKIEVKNAGISNIPAKKEAAAKSKSSTKEQERKDKANATNTDGMEAPAETSVNNNAVETKEYLYVHTIEAEGSDEDFFQEALVGNTNERPDVQADEIRVPKIKINDDTEDVEQPEETLFSINLSEASRDLVVGSAEEIDAAHAGKDSYQPNIIEAPITLIEQTQPTETNELSVPIEEVGEAVTELAEHIEKLEGDKAEEAHKILDKIVLKIETVQTEPENRANTGIEAKKPEEIEEELKNFFIELFNYTEIEYTPELIDSFVMLGIKIDISKLIVEAEQKEEIQLPQDSGTHEILKKLLIAVTTLKKKAHHTYHIGKLTLYLYFPETLANEPM